MTRNAFAGIALVAAIALSLAPPAAAQPKVRTLTEQELVDMMVGSSIQASRGSNSEGMIKRIKDALAQGKTFTMISVEDLPDDWMTVTPAGVGGGGAWQYVIDRTKQQNLQALPDAQMRAIEALSKHIGKKFNATIRVEATGATVTALLAAVEMGVPIVDACLSGRARPEIQQQIPWVNGIPATPAALVTRWGDTIILDKTVDDYRAEDLARAVAVSSGGGSPMALNPMSGRDVKRGVIRGALTQAILFGRTVREAREQGRDPIAALVKATNGYKLFHGIVTKSDQKGDRGFSWADVELRGINEFAGHTYKVFVKNENIVTWLDGKVDAMSPDFIQNLDPKTGDAISGAGGGLGGYPMNREVVIIAFPNAPAQWRTPKGLEVFGPRHFGFDFDYVPIEELQKGKSR